MLSFTAFLVRYRTCFSVYSVCSDKVYNRPLKFLLSVKVVRQKLKSHRSETAKIKQSSRLSVAESRVRLDLTEFANHTKHTAVHRAENIYVRPLL